MPCNAPSLALKILPSNPVPAESGRIKLFAKADGLYTIDAAGNVLPVDLNASAFALTLLDDPDAASMRSTLGLVIGTNVQAHAADLDAFVANASWSGSSMTLAGSLTVTLGMVSLTDITANAGVFCDTITVNSTFLNGAGVQIDSNILIPSGNLDVSGDSTFNQVIVGGAISMPTGPSISSGSAVPTSSEPDGSIYLRSGSPNGSLYVRQNGVWVLK
jgi:hypothetical protein